MPRALPPLLLALTFACGGAGEPEAAPEPEAAATSAGEERPDAPPADPGAPARPRVSLEEATIEGRRPPDEYAELVRATTEPPLRDILECYEARLAEDPTLQGALRLRLWVSAHEVIRVTVVEPLDDEPLQACAVEQIYAIEIPEEVPRAGATVRFVLRFGRGPREAPADPEIVLVQVGG